MANNRVYQDVVEVVVVNSSPPGRVYQEAAEQVVTPSATPGRAYQETAEAPVTPTVTPGRVYQETAEIAKEAIGSGLVTQQVVEALGSDTAPALVTQLSIEAAGSYTEPPVFVTQAVIEALFTMRTPIPKDLVLDCSVAHTVGSNCYLRNVVHADLTLDMITLLEVSADLEISVPHQTTVGKDLTLTTMISATNEPPKVKTVVRVDGVDITDDVMFERSTWVMNAGPTPGTGEIWVRDPNHTASFTTGVESTLDIGGLRIWGGFVMGIKRAYAFDVDDTTVPSETMRFLVLEISDYNILFQKRFILNKDDPTKEIPLYSAWKYDSAVVKMMVQDHLDLSSDGIDLRKVDHVGSPNEEYEGASYAPSESWGVAMSRTAQLPGAIFYIDPDKVLNYADVDIADAPFSLSDQPNDTTLRSYSRADILMDGTALCNDALVWGAGIALDRMTFDRQTDATSQTDHGLWQWADYRQDLWRPMSVERRARTYVHGSDQNKRGHKDDAVSIKCTTFNSGLRAGMRVRFINAAHGYDDVIPIRSMRITFSNPWEARYELSLAHVLDDAWNTAEFWQETVRVCEGGTSGAVTDPVTTQAGLYTAHGRHTWETVAVNRVYYSGSGDENWPAGEGHVYPTQGPIEPVHIVHTLQNGAGVHPNDFGSIHLLGDGTFDLYCRVKMLSVAEGAQSALLELKRNSETVASDEWIDARTGLRVVSFDLTLTRNDIELSAGDVLWAELSFANPGNAIAYGDWVIPHPWLPQDMRLTAVGSAVEPGGLTLSRPYVPGSTVAYDTDGNEVAVVEVDPGAGTVRAPGAVSVCYETYVGNGGDGWFDGTNLDGSGGVVLPPPPGGTVYRPKHRKQLGWGTALDGSNCTMASACIALDRHTEGAKTATPPQMRAEQYDQTGGTDLNDARIAWANGWNETLRVRYSLSWQSFINNIRSGRGGILQGMYRTIPRQYSCQYGSDFGHAIYVNEISDDGMALVYDPLCTGPRWMPISVLETYGKSFTGGSSVNAAFTRVTA